MGRWLRLSLAVVLGLPLAYFLAALLGAVVPGPAAEPVAPTGEPVVLHLLGGPIHTDLLLPATPEARAAFAFAEQAGVPIDRAAYILVGWGAHEFYTATGTYADLTPGPVWRAITGDRAVLRVDAVGPVSSPLPGLPLTVDRASYEILLGRIAADVAGGPVVGAGFTPTDAFFAAEGRFHLFNTCNVWVSEQLRDAGVPFGLWTPTPYAVRLSWAWHHGAANR